MKVLCVLPARLGSERIPRKPLVRLAGRPLVEWSWRSARAVEAFDEVWVATDSDEIAEVVEGFGGRAVLTEPGHPSGTDRVAEAAARPEARSYEIVVNYQADEPFLPPAPVARAVDEVRGGAAEIATLAAPVRSEDEWRAEGVVKVVRGRDGDALYFSRAPVPHPRDAGTPWSGGDSNDDGEGPSGQRSPFLRHVGVYVFRRRALERWVELPPSPLEELERLEQLRALEAGMRIRVAVGPEMEPGVDEPADLRRAERILARRSGREAPPAREGAGPPGRRDAGDGDARGDAPERDGTDG